MTTLDLSMLNASSILGDLQATLQTLQPLESRYLRPFSEQELVVSGAVKRLPNALGIQEEPLPHILRLLGVRSLTLKNPQELTPLASLSVDLPGNAASEKHQWAYLRSEAVVTQLRLLFLNCRTIAFDDWSKITAASDLWDGLLEEVLRPLGQMDLEFVFYLGNPLTKLFFEVDEVLDILGDFSRHGQVTLALDESEAINLWRVLNGVPADTPLTPQSHPDLKKKYFSIFRMMSITRLLIYSANAVILFTNHQQFVLTRQRVDSRVELAPDARQNFVAGYSLGLLRGMDAAHCIALGLVVFGSAGQQPSSPRREDLLAYLNRWQQELQQPETTHLYQ